MSAVPKGPPRQRETFTPEPDFLLFLRNLPCPVCWPIPNITITQAHHLMRGVPRGMGKRAPDRYAIPLCAKHHLASYGADTAHGHGNDAEWLASKGIDGWELADQLWRIWTETPEDMTAALQAIGGAKR